MADLAKLLVRLEGENIKLVKSLDQATKKIDKFNADSNRTLKSFQDGFKRAFTAIAGYVAIDRFSDFIKQTTAATAEIGKFAALANSSTTEFQKFAFAARSVGFENEKVADVLKDINDKMGDFLSTGAGPMVDFFEQIAPRVGITTAAFAKLSGPQALQLYVKSLEEAGVSQQQMTFYMEALASDATALVPLLRNNASELKRLGDQAQRAGLILSEDLIARSRDANAQFKLLDAVTASWKRRLAAELAPTLAEMSGLLTDIATDEKAVVTITAGLSAVMKAAAVAGIALSTTFANVGRAIGGLAAAAAAAGEDTGESFLQGFARGGLRQGISNLVSEGASGGLDRASRIIDDFTADNERATADAERRISGLFSGAFEQAGKDAAALNELLNAPGGGNAPLSRIDPKLAQDITGTIKALELQAATLGMSADAAKRYELQLKGASDAQLKHVESLQNQIAADKELQDSLDREAEAIGEARDKWADLQVQLREVDSVALKYISDIETLKTAHDLGVISTEQLNASLEKLGEQYVKAMEKNKGWREQFEKSVERVGSGMQGALEDFFFAPAEKGFDGLFESFSNLLRRMAAEIAAQAVMQQLFKGLNNLGGGFAEIGGLLSGVTARAIGGPVTAGAPVLVGEKGPELFFPASSGTIATARQTEGMLGGGGVNVIVNTPNADSFRQSRRQVASAVKRGLLA